MPGPCSSRMGFRVMSHVWGRYTLALLLSSLCLTGVAQETKGKTAMKAGKKSGAVKVEKVSGRLPRHFASIVDNTQRTKIYRIQISYRERIAELERELAELAAAEMKEMEGVLTTDQREQLAERRAGSLQRKSPTKAAPNTKASTKKASTEKPATPKAASTRTQPSEGKTRSAKASSSKRTTSKSSSKKPAATSAGKSRS
jgi:hypothetical protein